MKFVLENIDAAIDSQGLYEEPLNVYLCDDADLPERCFYFDTDNMTIIYRFQHEPGLVIMKAGRTEESLEYRSSICETYKTSAEMKILINDIMSYVSNLGISIDLYSYLLRKNERNLRILAARMLDFYIQHKPCNMKSALRS